MVEPTHEMDDGMGAAVLSTSASHFATSIPFEHDVGVSICRRRGRKRHGVAIHSSVLDPSAKFQLDALVVGLDPGRIVHTLGNFVVVRLKGKFTSMHEHTRLYRIVIRRTLRLCHHECHRDCSHRIQCMHEQEATLDCHRARR